MRSKDEPEQQPTMALANESKTLDEIAVVLRRFGDEQSMLLDQFERLSIEVQLNQAILGRSLSEPGVSRTRFKAPPPPLVTQVTQGRRRRSGFHRVLKRLLQPIFGKKGKGKAERMQVSADPKNQKYWKAGFRRSLRL